MPYHSPSLTSSLLPSTSPWSDLPREDLWCLLRAVDVTNVPRRAALSPPAVPGTLPPCRLGRSSRSNYAGWWWQGPPTAALPDPPLTPVDSPGPPHPDSTVAVAADLAVCCRGPSETENMREAVRLCAPPPLLERGSHSFLPTPASFPSPPGAAPTVAVAGEDRSALPKTARARAAGVPRPPPLAGCTPTSESLWRPHSPTSAAPSPEPPPVENRARLYLCFVARAPPPAAGTTPSRQPTPRPEVPSCLRPSPVGVPIVVAASDRSRLGTLSFGPAGLVMG